MPERQDEVVYVLDDDFRIREALLALLLTFDLKTVPFASAAEYLAYPKPDIPSCLLLDVHLPDMNGLDLQSLLAIGPHPHVVFITGRGDIPSTVRAMRTGAVDFLTKPFQEADLIRAVRLALAENRKAIASRAQLLELQRRLAALTPREREIFPLVVGGLLNKQVAAELKISEITVQIHRSNFMRKMGAESLPDLVRMAEKLQIPLTLSRASSKRRSGSSDDSVT